MCGIAGIFSFDGPALDAGRRIMRMCDAMVHRGPDDEGYFACNSQTEHAAGSLARREQIDTAFERADVVLGVRRLAITDIGPSGHQPMHDAERGTTLVFNGAIHNHAALRDELQRAGCVFRSRSDTEVVLHAYATWGTEAVHRFNGMWAFALWDARERTLVLSRDRFGIKPLFVAQDASGIQFASELQALMAGGAIAREPDNAYLAHVFDTPIPVLGRRSCIDGVSQLPAATTLTISHQARDSAVYWRYPPPDATPMTDRQAIDTFCGLLEESTRLRTQADVPCGLLLSGGMDSSALAILMGEHADGSPGAYTARFDGFGDDESPFAAITAAQAGIPHTMIDFQDRDLGSLLGNVCWHMGMPISEGQQLARWQLLERASRDVTVVLEGQGADEMLGGYPNEHARPYLESEWESVRAGSAAALWPLAAAAYRFRTPLLVPGARRLVRRWRQRNSERVHAPDRPLLAFAGAPPDAIAASRDDATRSPLDRTLIDDHSRTGLPFLLAFGDALAMAHSVESRQPFLDHRLVEHVFRIGPRHKIHGGVTKTILRAAMGDRMPEQILNRRRKIGFSTPLDDWMRGGWASTFEPLLRDARTLQRGFFDPAALATLTDRFAQHQRHADKLLRVVATEIWFRQFIDGEGRAVELPA